MNNNSNSVANNGGNINLKYKTSRCRHFDSTGNCQLGDRCHFAHGDHELRTINDPLRQDQVEHAQRPVQYMKPAPQGGAGGPSGGSRGHHHGDQNGYQRGGFRGGRGDHHQQNQGGNHYQNGNNGNHLMQFQTRGGGAVQGGPHGMHGGPGFDQYPVGMPMYPPPPLQSSPQLSRGPSTSSQPGQSPAGNGMNGYPNFKTVPCKFFNQGRTCPYKDRCSFAHGDTDLRQQQQEQMQAAAANGPGQMHMPQQMMPPPMPQPPVMTQAQQPYLQGGVFGAYNMPVDMMHQPMTPQGAWDPSIFSPVVSPQGGIVGGNPYEMSYMMGGGMGMIPTPQPPQMSNIFELPVRFIFPQQQTTPEGQIVPGQTVMESYFIEKSPSILDEVQRAFKLNQDGAYEECLSLLMKLYESKRVFIQQVNSQPTMPYGMPGTMGMMSPQQPVQ